MNKTGNPMMNIWYTRCDMAQESLYNNFWNPNRQIMNQGVPADNQHNRLPIYWWHAHVIDVLVDALNRGKDKAYKQRLWDMFNAVRVYNGNTLHHNFYDDMEWMALALLRAWDSTGNHEYRQGALALWEDIKTAWNPYCGGGMAWKKDQLDYKNTPANAPAAILACRLYQRFNNNDDLIWSKRIYEWNRVNLVDPESGFVWDGMNRRGDGRIDKDWRFTYCQGIFIGAAVELYRTTHEQHYLDAAVKTAFSAKKELADPVTHMLPDEGNGDCGLFKGIFIRYVLELLKLAPALSEISSMLALNASSLWDKGRDPKTGLFSQSWQDRPEPVVDLSTHLSGIMLTEAMSSWQVT